MLRELLQGRRIRIQRQLLRESLQQIDKTGHQSRSQKRLHRHIYNVQGPNYLCHIDTNHKLVRWYFIITGVVDGYSQLPVGLSFTDDKKACTILQCFLNAVEDYGLQSRLGSGKVKQNVLVSDYILEKGELADEVPLRVEAHINKQQEDYGRMYLTGYCHISTISFISWTMKAFQICYKICTYLPYISSIYLRLTQIIIAEIILVYTSVKNSQLFPFTTVGIWPD